MKRISFENSQRKMKGNKVEEDGIISKEDTKKEAS